MEATSTFRERLRFAEKSRLERNTGRVPEGLPIKADQGSDEENLCPTENIPVPDCLTYFPFQRDGITFLASRKAALLADDMGLGKSVQTIGFLNYLTAFRSCLIVCPASLKTNWAREFDRWLCDKNRSISVSTGAESKNDLGADIVIINYDLLWKFHSVLSRRRWEVIVCDEGHYLKNPKARRTKIAMDLASRAERRILLTGTPVLSRPSELWSLLNILDPIRWPNFYRFAHRYCAPVRTQWGWDFTGASNQRELAEMLRGGLMLRRLKKEVLPQLPIVTRQIIALSVDTSPLLWTLTCKVAELYGFDPYNPPFRIDPEKIPFELISEIRRETGALKAEVALDFIRDQTMDYGQKTVIFAHHLDLLKSLYEAFKETSVLVTGETPLFSRQKAVDAFQNDIAIQYFIASTRAMGQGITLTASSHVIFVEADWVPSILDQAEARLHRIGQRSNVLVQYLVLAGTLDERILAAVQEKRTVINEIIETHPKL